VKIWPMARPWCFADLDSQDETHRPVDYNHYSGMYPMAVGDGAHLLRRMLESELEPNAQSAGRSPQTRYLNSLGNMEMSS
jgi:hypothetical protein